MIPPRWLRRQLTTAATIGVCVLLCAIIIVRRHDKSRNHYLSPELMNHAIKPTLGQDSLLTRQESTRLCRQHGFSTYGKTRKVYDLVLFSTELDWLEIRLNTLAAYVDYFVVIESPTTFTNKPKPLILQENWNRFEKYHEKMIYMVVQDPVVSTRHWDHEDFFRNALLREVFINVVGTSKEAHRGDVLLISDMDEIIRPGVALLLRYCDFPSRLTLRTHFYYYSFQWYHHGEQWAHPDATIFGGTIANTIAPNDLRQGLLGPGLLPFAALSRWWNRATLWNAGWHCSSCFATIEEMRTKMQSFSHQPWNTAGNRDARVMMSRVRNGLDLFGREGEIYDRVEHNEDVPEYILSQNSESGKFKYLLNRDGEDAGFEDWNVTSNAD
ncbi:hypothetical protein LTR10_007676 [Elasticomyces elasticus]|nr:hypothetical protein LTR10_007676 [Elasticomyces elasticus]